MKVHVPTRVRAVPGWPAAADVDGTAPFRVLTDFHAFLAWRAISTAAHIGFTDVDVQVEHVVALWPHLTGDAAQLVVAVLEQAGQAHLLWVAAAGALAGRSSFDGGGV